MTRTPDPFDELERVFDVMSGQLGADFDTLAVDIADEGDQLVVVADLPGFDQEDIEVKLLDGTTLHLQAHHSDRYERTEPEQWVQRERHDRSISRTISLPEPVDETESQGSYDQGVLTIQLPKRTAEPDEGTDVPVN